MKMPDLFNDNIFLVMEGHPKADTIILIWLKLLCLADESDRDNPLMLTDDVPFNESMIASVFRKPVEIVEEALTYFESLNLIRRDKGYIYVNESVHVQGDKNSRNNAKYQRWRKAVLTRDEYLCQGCLTVEGSGLHVHHIKPWALYPELRYDVDNGLTLCAQCHKEIHQAMKRWEKDGK